MRKAALTLFFCAASLAAHASYEMMFVMAETTEAGTYMNKVHRVDPSSGAVFGSFLVHRNVKAMVADKSRGELATIDSDGNVRVYDYSTGLLVSAMGSPAFLPTDMILAGSGRALVVNGSGTIRAVNWATQTTSTVAMQTGTYKRLALGPLGTLFAGNEQNSTIDRFNPSGSSYTFAGQSALTAPAGYSLGQMCVTPRTSGIYGNLFYGLGSRAGYSVLDGNEVPIGTNYFAATNHATVTAIVAAHAGTYFVGADSVNTSLTRITSVDVFNYYNQSFTLSTISGGARCVAMVVAPEPGTLVALGLGMLALLRRRR